MIEFTLTSGEILFINPVEISDIVQLKFINGKGYEYRITLKNGMCYMIGDNTEKIKAKLKRNFEKE